MNIELLSNQIENMKAEIDSILSENNELRKLLDKSNDHLNESGLFRNKISKLEEALKFERLERGKIDSISQQLSQKLKENELKTFAEFSKLKNFVVSKDEEMENIKIKYENKINKVKSL
jgi:hypothetical protein